MVKRGRGLLLAALGSVIRGAPVHAQQAAPPAPVSTSVGPPALRDFELQPDNQMRSTAEPGPIIAPLAPSAPTGERQRPPASEPVVSIAPPPAPIPAPTDRQGVVSGQSVSVRVDLGVCSIINKKRTSH